MPQKGIHKGDDGVEVGAREGCEYENQYSKAQRRGEGIFDQLQANVGRQEPLRSETRSENDRGQEGAAEKFAINAPHCAARQLAR